jgi:5-formyltetrahydrofolate cyclo-ligase
MLREAKMRLREEAKARREALEGREERSARIHAAVLALPEWAAARTISTYVGVGAEVATLPLIETALAQGKRVAVPRVEGSSLTLYRIEATTELEPAPFGLLEPGREYRRKNRRLVATEVHLFLVPGLAFDRNGGRLGYGKGYYDALLGRVKSRIPTVGLAFDIQVIDEVPMTETDVRLSCIVTETGRHARQVPELPPR